MRLLSSLVIIIGICIINIIICIINVHIICDIKNSCFFSTFLYIHISKIHCKIII